MRAYLAGPDVFLPDPVAVGQRKKDICAMYGIEGVYPLDANLDLAGLPQRAVGVKISAANEELIRSCDLLIANITPFRGPSADVGTAFEMGFARALGLPVFAYTNSLAKFCDRVRDVCRTRRRANGDLEDDHGMLLESMDFWDNLMLDGAVLQSGGTVEFGYTPGKRFEDLTNFRKAVESAYKRLNLLIAEQ